MHIRAGYEITYECPAADADGADAERASRRASPISLTPATHDPRSSGRGARLPRHLRQHLLRASSRPPGRITISSDFLINDSGAPDIVEPEADAASRPGTARRRHGLSCSAAATATPTTSPRWPGRCSATARTGWARVQAICDYVHERLTFGYQHASATRTAWDGFREQRGVCRDFAHLAITLCRCMNIPARYCTGYLGDIGVPVYAGADGFQRLVRGLSRRPLVHLRCAPQRAAHRPHPDGARTRRHRRRALHQLRRRRGWPASRSITDEVVTA